MHSTLTTGCKFGLLILLMCGCVDPGMFQKQKQAETEKEATAPETEPAPAQNAQPAGTGGPIGSMILAPDTDSKPAGQPQAQAPANQAPAQPSFPQDNTKLVDKKAVLAENPNLVETENRINATDPLTAVSQSYFSIGSRAQLMALKHAVDLHKAQYDKPPTFAEFESMLKSSGAALKGLYRWQVYAYDETTGQIVILEDRAMKKRLYEEQGLKLDE